MDIFKPADILIPKTDLHKWSVIACDQFTSEPEYWRSVRDEVGTAPSALNIILPEAELGGADMKAKCAGIWSCMSEYLNGGIFDVYPDSFICLERTLPDGSIRRGIVGAFDLDTYDWAPDAETPIRATEGTVAERLPARVEIRSGAPLESPHIMMFMDDKSDTVFSSVSKGELVYDFPLMLGGGSIKGWRVADNAALLAAVDSLGDEELLKSKYGTAADPVIFATGDGNHSLAAAKSHWDNLKKTLTDSERATHPARYALAELVNIHDDAIRFEAIHKVIFKTDPAQFISDAEKFFAPYSGEGREITLMSPKGDKTLSIAGLTIGELIGRCEDFCRGYIASHGGYIDYVHGEDECASMSHGSDSAGIMLPRMDKSELFASVIKSGPFPRKSFSIGHGRDKRYYLECRRI